MIRKTISTARSARRREILTGVLMLLPIVIAVLVLRVWPFFIAVVGSLISDAPGHFVDLRVYRSLFEDTAFTGSLVTTGIFSAIVNPVQIITALAIALLLNRRIPGAAIWRTLVVLPVVIPQSISAVIWGVALRPDGPINGLLAALGIPQQGFLTSTAQALPSIIVVVSWVGVGYWMTFLVAGLKDIPFSLYEAAQLDGANSWGRFIHITLPLLRRPLAFVLVADTVSNFLVFAPIQILTKGGPQGTTNLAMSEIFTRTFVYGDTKGGAAATVILVMVVMAVVLIQFRMMRSEA
jgi:multiple sugar transport system permease protein